MKARIQTPGTADPRLTPNQWTSEGAGFRIAGYDESNVEEIGDRLDGMSAAEIRTVRKY